MDTQTSVDQLIQKTRRYEFSDGLRDFQLAILLGFGGVTSWISFEPFWITFIGNLSLRYGRWAAWIGMLPMLLLILAVWGMLWLMKKIRQRWLWRNSGMVNASKWMVSRRVNILSAVIIIASISISLFMRSRGWVENSFVLRMIWAATGWGFGFTLIGVGREFGLLRYQWLGLVGAGLSTLMLFIPLTFGQSSLVFGLLWFVLLMISGWITLRSAIRTMQTGQV
jgi:hypothetical protein